MFPEIPLSRTVAQRRLSFLASRRSMAEMERLLHRFLVAELTRLDDAECQRMEGLLVHPDADLLDWLVGIKPCPSEVDAEALLMLARHASEYHAEMCLAP
ncbi:MAG: succinate dehydrogenase assembly factor 2 [Magnetococcus sp. YQC-5]